MAGILEWNGGECAAFFHGCPVRGARVLVCVKIFIRRSVSLTGRISRDTENGLPDVFFFRRDGDF